MFTFAEVKRGFCSYTSPLLDTISLITSAWNSPALLRNHGFCPWQQSEEVLKAPSSQKRCGLASCEPGGLTPATVCTLIRMNRHSRNSTEAGSVLVSQYWCVQVKQVLSCHELMLGIAANHERKSAL